MEIKFKNYSLQLREKQTSSFDHSFAGQIADNGKYYVCLTDYKTHEHYCVERGSEIKWTEDNVLCEGDEPQIICGNLVRPMTYKEECLYNEDKLMEIVDIFGNVSCTEEFDVEWYMENCI